MRVLISGVNGQDGAYLAKKALSEGHMVYGTSRDAATSSFNNLKRLGIENQVKILSMATNDFRSVLSTLNKTEPDQLFLLSGQSSVGLSFEQPVETLESIAISTLNILEAIRFTGAPIKLYHASSSECFGDVGDIPASEQTPFHPNSPYAVAKASAHWLVSNYRDAYGLFASNGILFNHESPLRPARFVTQKIIASVARISAGSGERLTLGRLDIVRDWGWAPEYVDAMWQILQHPEPDDFVIATGEANSLQDFVETSFSVAGLDWRDHVDSDANLLRPSDIPWSQGNPEKARIKLGWEAKTKMRDVIRLMYQAEQEKSQSDHSCESLIIYKSILS